MEKTPRNLMASDDPPKIVVFAVSAVRCQDPAMANSSFGLMMLFFSPFKCPFGSFGSVVSQPCLTTGGYH
jgi:hypothetical protein